MKKLFILSTISALMASGAYAVDITESGMLNSPIAGDLNFTTDGVVLTRVSAAIVNGNITVAENVTATIDMQSNLELKGGVISGASKETSVFDFQGYHLSTTRSSTSPNPCANLTIQNVTLKYTGDYGSGNASNNWTSVPSANGGILRAGVTTIDNANVEMIEGKFGIHRVDSSDTASVILKNGSTLTFAEKRTGDNLYAASIDFGSTASGLTANQKMMQLTGNSKLEVKNSLNFSGLGIDATDSSVVIKTGTNVGTVKLNNSTLEVQSSMTGTNGTTSAFVISSLSGKNTISGTGTMRARATSGNIELGSAEVNLVLSNAYVAFQDNKVAGTLRIGSDGTKHDYQTQLYGVVQFNSGRVIVGSNAQIGSTSSRSDFNLASYTSSTTVSDSIKSNIMAGAKIYAGKSRIMTGTFDGYISTTTIQSANGWNHSLAFGAFSTTNTGNNQKANITLGENAQVDVTPTASTYFGLYGNVDVNAKKDMLVSNANAPLMIYKDSVITLNSTDAFKVGGATSQAESDFNFFADHTNIKLAVNADNNIGRFVYGSSLTEVALDIATGKLLTVGSVELASGADYGTVALILGDNIERGMLRITDMDDILANYGSSYDLIFTDTLGSDRVLGENLFLENVDGDYLVYTVAVPEPAEWAMIIGALALGFVAYRRRK